jgi:hypothetical protein
MDRFEFQCCFEKAKENLGKDYSACQYLMPISWIEKGAFLPGAGVLYCPREHCGAKVGAEGSLIPLDMTWLRLHEDVTAGQGRRYSFGEDGYVKCFSLGKTSREECCL